MVGVGLRLACLVVGALRSLEGGMGWMLVVPM